MQTAIDYQEQETRLKILLAAYEEIHALGFQAASLNKILASTNVTKGALYHYFSNKLELGYAVVDEIIADQVQQRWVDPLLKADDPLTALKEIIMQAGEEISETDIECGCPLNNLAQEMAPVDDGFRSRVENIYKNWREGIKQAFLRGQQLGIVKQNIDIESVATMIVASLEGCIGLAKNAQSKTVLFQCGKSIMDYLDSLRA